MSRSFEHRRDRIDRVRARAWALQILYRWEAGVDEISLRDAMVETTGTRRVSPRRLPFVRAVLKEAEAHMDEIDRRITGSLSNWTLERVAAIDRALLRLATAELLYMEDIPPKVSIQEAVRLAEQYGGPDSPRFVNGVLDALWRSAKAEREAQPVDVASSPNAAGDAGPDSA
ncbi:MAG TPA: transcription antitermination factor NusB [Longimicrobiales bacterium]|nr:transcription antitermination factor NusB [Longimicrobiales bacterium]